MLNEEIDAIEEENYYYNEDSLEIYEENEERVNKYTGDKEIVIVKKKRIKEYSKINEKDRIKDKNQTNKDNNQDGKSTNSFTSSKQNSEISVNNVRNTNLVCRFFLINVYRIFF